MEGHIFKNTALELKRIRHLSTVTHPKTKFHSRDGPQHTPTPPIASMLGCSCIISPHYESFFSNPRHPEWISRQPMRGQSTRTPNCCKCLIRPSRLIIPLPPVHLSELDFSTFQDFDFHKSWNKFNTEPYWGFIFIVELCPPHRRAGEQTETPSASLKVS